MALDERIRKLAADAFENTVCFNSIFPYMNNKLTAIAFNEVDPVRLYHYNRPLGFDGKGFSQASPSSCKNSGNYFVEFTLLDGRVHARCLLARKRTQILLSIFDNIDDLG